MKYLQRRTRLSDLSFHWGNEQDEAFVALKNALVQAPVLVYPQFDKSFIIEVDASGEGLGACLSQKDNDGKPYSSFVSVVL